MWIQFNNAFLSIVENRDNKSELLDGLFFVAAGTHPGAGVPGVLSSAKVLDKIL